MRVLMTSKVLCVILVWAWALSIAQAHSPNFAFSEIIGKVHFKAKKTITPMAMCGLEGCPTSEKYWVLWVEAENGNFEIDEIFALGSETAPESIEIAGIPIRPGSQIGFTGDVYQVSDDYALVSEIENLTLLMDLRALPGSGERAVSPMGWGCKSGAERERALYVQIWPVAGLSTGETYQLRVIEQSAIVSGEFIEVVRIEDVKLTEGGRNLIYEGSTPTIKAHLEIEKSQGLPMNLPARLYLLELGRILPYAQFSSEISLICTQTRIFRE